MFNELLQLFQSNLPKAIGVMVSCIIIICLIVWVAVIDIKRQSVVFWKLLIVSASFILLPTILSFFFNESLKWYLLLALGIWALLLLINIFFNKEKIIGKADIDILAPLVSLCVGMTLWFYNTLNYEAALAKITTIWYSLFIYLFAGSVIFLACFLIYYLIVAVKNKENFIILIRGKKISALPMLIPASVMIPYIVMTVQ